MNNKINSFQIFVLSFLLCCSHFPGFGNVLLLIEASSTSLIVSLVSLPFILLVIGLLIYISKKTNGQNIFEYNKEKFKGLGMFFNFLLVVFYLYLAFMMTWHSSNFIVSQFLINTPYILVIICFFSILLYGVIKGIETISRTSIILFVFFMINYLFITSSLFNQVELNNLLPLFNIKSSNFIMAVIKNVLYSTAPIFLILSIDRKKIVDNKNFNKAVILGTITGAIAVITLLFLCLSILGIDLCQLYAFPEYALFKKIKILNFIQRVENFVSLNNFIILFIELAMVFYSIKKYLLYRLKKVNNKIKISNILISIIVFAIPITSTYVFINYRTNFLFTKYIFFISPLYLFVLLSLLANLFKRKTRNQS